jgi:DNA-binding SARP family transcriptional activator
MDVRVLGPVEVCVGGAALPLGAAKLRASLAMLALRANRTVSADQLMEGLWGEHPPASAPKLVQQQVSRLRRLLADAEASAAEIRTHGRGYELAIAPEAVDVCRFERLVADGCPREALALWRGPALADIADEPFAAEEIRRLDELRLQAHELAIDADLAAGRHREVLGELESLVREHPLRERLQGQLMLALYRSERQADALSQYLRLRTALVDGMGVEPGPPLRRLHEAILRHDPALAAPEPPMLETGNPLHGRDAELQRLLAAWARAQSGDGVVVVVRGPPGSGRTRLIAELAAEVHAPVITRADRLPGAPAVLMLDGLPVPDVAGRPVLVVVRATESLELPGATRIDLGPLDCAAVAAIAREHGVDGAELFERSRGMPGAAHRLAAEWARAATLRRLGDEADRTAAERHRLRQAESSLAGTVVDLQSARVRAGATPAVCPYKGLASFQEVDAPFFFGRERLVAQMVARLVGAPLLGVVGASGSGKSSALRAGLLAGLAAGVLPGSERWDRRVLRPGERPLQTLEAVVNGANGRLVLAVDQFEEVFTLCRDPGEREAFVAALVALAGDRTAVVLAVRADFYGHCAADPELRSLLSANTVLVGPMDDEERRRAIELPARGAGLRVEPALVDRLLADTAGEPGALPLLQSALLELWLQRDGRALTLDASARTGGVHGAIRRLAETVYARLTAEQQAIARGMLLRLAGEDAAGGTVRRLVPLT